MKISLQRLFTVFLMLAFGISGMLYFILDGAQFHYKLAADKHLSQKTNLDIVKIPLQELKASAGSGELWHDNRLYDVSSYVIIDDTAFVSVFHDEDEEGLVTAIAASFETGNEYCADNGPHISKHKTHVPNDGKVLMTLQFAWPQAVAPDKGYPVLCSFSYAPVINTAVIKPPPRLS